MYHLLADLTPLAALGYIAAAMLACYFVSKLDEVF